MTDKKTICYFKRTIKILSIFIIVSYHTAWSGWKEDYAYGIEAIDKQRYSEAVGFFNAAINEQPEPKKRVRIRGTWFAPYTPYYYKGIAQFKSGNYISAKASFEQSSQYNVANTNEVNTYLAEINNRAGAGNTAVTQVNTVNNNENAKKIEEQKNRIAQLERELNNLASEKENLENRNQNIISTNNSKLNQTEELLAQQEQKYMQQINELNALLNSYKEQKNNDNSSVIQELTAELNRTKQQAQNAEKERQELLAKISAESDNKPKQPVKVTDNRARYALVIGNEKYKKIPPLRTAVNDTTAIANQLKSIGYNVTLIQNVESKNQMKKEISDFTNSIKSPSIAMFYYAGHAIQFENTNYVVPTNAEINGPQDVVGSDDTVLLPQNYIASAFQYNRNIELSMLVFDSCRNNPFRNVLANTRSGIVNDGMAEVKRPPRGVLYFYSTSPGDVAIDNLGGKYSPFADAFIKGLQNPNTEYNNFIQNITNNVFKTTQQMGKEQIPWREGQLIGTFYVGK